jgi:methyltransferase OMS1, mitochondrial
MLESHDVVRESFRSVFVFVARKISLTVSLIVCCQGSVVFVVVAVQQCLFSLTTLLLWHSKAKPKKKKHSATTRSVLISKWSTTYFRSRVDRYPPLDKPFRSNRDTRYTTMAVNNMIRRAPLMVAAGGIYGLACYIGYTAIQTNKQDIQATEDTLRETGQSFVHNHNRNQRYEDVASTYDDQIGRDEMVMGINLLRRSLLYFNARGTVLEVAAGTGRNIQYYPSSTVDRVLMMDTSTKMLERAQQKIRKLNPPAVVVDQQQHQSQNQSQQSSTQKPTFACTVGDSASLTQFPDDCFDTVVDTFGLCSFDDPVCVLKEMARVCKPDGRVLLLEHGRSKTWDFITKYLDKHAERHAKNWGCCWNRDLDSIVERSGLQIDTIRTYHFGTTYYMVCSPAKEK